MKHLSKKSKVYGGLGALALVLLLLGFWGYQSGVQYVEIRAEELLQAEVKFKELELNPLAREVSLFGVRIVHPQDSTKTLAQVKKLSIQVMGFPTQRKNIPIAIHLHHPEISLVTNPKGQWELAGQVPLLSRGKDQKRPRPFNIENITAKNATITFTDGRVKKETILKDGKLSLKHLRLPDETNPLPTEFEAQWKIDGAQMKLKGKGDFLSPQTSIQANWQVAGFPLPPYAPYYDRGLPVRIQRGSAHFSSEVVLTQDQLNIPIHARVNHLDLELKKKNSWQKFGSDMAVKSLTNEAGQVELDLVVKGHLERPRFIITTDFQKAALAGMSEPFKKAGSKIKSGTKSGFKKVKNFFGGK